MKGQFITFEGTDGSGKSTHLRACADWLRSRGGDVVVTREPGGTALGQAVRQVFLDAPWEKAEGGVEALLVFASRRQHLVEVIDPALKKGQWVLCDRFTDSTLAYQGSARGETLDRLLQLDDWATGRRRPDLTLLYDLEVEEARLRSGSEARRQAASVNRLDEENLDFYRKVRAGYLELATAEPERFRVIDSSGPRGETEKQSLNVMSEFWKALP